MCYCCQHGECMVDRHPLTVSAWVPCSHWVVRIAFQLALTHLPWKFIAMLMVTVNTVKAALGGLSPAHHQSPVTTTTSHIYRITAFTIHRAAVVTGRQSTVIIIQAQITDARLSWPTHTSRLQDTTLCRSYSYYVRRITFVWLAKTEIEIKLESNYLQKN